MRKLYLFMMTTLDGYFEGVNHDISWHNVDAEFANFAVTQLDATSTLIFGARTYRMMAEFWPTDKAREDDPETAQRMNDMKKVVFSHTLERVDWTNTTLHHDDVVETVQALKQEDGKDIAVLGSSNLCVSLLEEQILDELRIMVNPTVIGAGTSLFAGLSSRHSMRLANTRQFTSGNVLLTYTTQS